MDRLLNVRKPGIRTSKDLLPTDIKRARDFLKRTMEEARAKEEKGIEGLEESVCLRIPARACEAL